MNCFFLERKWIFYCWNELLTDIIFNYDDKKISNLIYFENEWISSYIACLQQSILTLECTDLLPLFYLTPPCDAIPPSRTLQLISSYAPDGCLFFPLSFFLFVLLPTPGIRTAAAGCIVETQFKSDLHHVLPAISSHPRAKWLLWFDVQIRPSSSPQEKTLEFHSISEKISIFI